MKTGNIIGDSVREFLGDNMLAWAANSLISVLSLMGFVSLSAFFLIWLERKISARFQGRLGPTRVGPFGLLQTIADAIKLTLKEGIFPKGADKPVYFLAPLFPMTASFLMLIVLPFSETLQVVDLNAGVLYAIAVSGLGIVGLLLAGWASNNKYSLFGSLRTGAQMVSYEITIALCLLVVVIITGTTSFQEIVQSQKGTVLDWWIFKLPVVGFLTFIIFMVASIAETNRGPFDIAEAESELTAGFHTEYSGIYFSMFFLAEFINMFIGAGFGATLFLGGYLAPQFGIAAIDKILMMVPGVVWFMLKTYFLVIFTFMWARWTFPRLRIDQLIAMEWKFMLPASLVLILLSTIFTGMGWIL